MSEKPTHRDESDLKLNEYVEWVLDTGNDDRSQREAAEELGVSERTIYRWRKRVDWQWVKDERRRRYSHEMIEVDKAMLRAAKGGDVSAAKYVAERYDGYTPATVTHQIHEVDESLVDEELNALIERKRASLDAIADTHVDAKGRGQAKTAGPAQGVPKAE